MPLVQTRGAASAQGFGEFAKAGAVTYIEDVFSTYLYTGNGSTQTITNGIDLSTKGGLVWLKDRVGANSHRLFDTNRGAGRNLTTNTTAAQLYSGSADGVTGFNTTGFGLNDTFFGYNQTGVNYVSWTFREQAKFFDIVTYTGTGVNRTIAHNINGTVGCIIVKRTDTTGDWQVYHNSLTSAAYSIQLNLLNAQASTPTIWNSTAPTSTVFSVGTDASVNANGGTYVAYLFAHNAGGFGLTGTDNVISCGSYVGNISADVVVNLGFEPQFVLLKQNTAGQNWYIWDTMRGLSVASPTLWLSPNSSAAEVDPGSVTMYPTATGFVIPNGQSNAATYIYIAIRRGPMKVPTTGTSVFGMSARSGTGANATVTGGQTDDAVLIKNRGSAVASLFASRLTGTGYLVTSSTAAEVAAGATILQANPWDVMDGVKVGTTSTITNASANTYINYLFKRAPSFMDVVCYAGTGVAMTVAHNLQAVPQLIIVRERNFGNSWRVQPLSDPTNRLALNTTAAQVGSGPADWDSTAPTSSVFSVGSGGTGINQGGGAYITYIFATCAGVSKVGSYTGNGTTQTIDCGLTAGARFVLLKRTDSTGDWYVYDTARGMTVLTDPYWLTNTTAAEVATLGSVTTVATGFALNSTILAAINVNAGTYIFLAIA